MKMKTDVYQSNRNGEKYLFVKAGINIKELKFPFDIDPDVLVLASPPFKSDFEIDSKQPRFSFDADEIENIIKQIEENGYAVEIVPYPGSETVR